MLLSLVQQLSVDLGDKTEVLDNFYLLNVSLFGPTDVIDFTWTVNWNLEMYDPRLSTLTCTRLW